jgi:hypothetical protein
VTRPLEILSKRTQLRIFWFSSSSSTFPWCETRASSSLFILDTTRCRHVIYCALWAGEQTLLLIQSSAHFLSSSNSCLLALFVLLYRCSLFLHFTQHVCLFIPHAALLIRPSRIHQGASSPTLPAALRRACFFYGRDERVGEILLTEHPLIMLYILNSFIHLKF